MVTIAVPRVDALFQSAPLTKARGDGEGGGPAPARSIVSIRSPHKSKGRPPAKVGVKVGRPCFNPLPSQKQGETGILFVGRPLLIVSIRSPHKSKGRQEEFVQAHVEDDEFQSAPLTKARGDIGAAFSVDPARLVSIRSPHKSKGRPSSWATWFVPSMFQSAPLTKARGDRRQHGLCGLLLGFNPLPSQKQGETSAVAILWLSGHVSIRSPHKSKGRHPSAARAGATRLFQSAPLTKARGDGLQLGHPRIWRLFQSAPLTKARGDRARRAGRTGPPRFNPLPSQKQGETFLQGCTSCQLQVSIRSPHKSKGRRLSNRTRGMRRVFQSAPLTKARGDVYCQ